MPLLLSNGTIGEIYAPDPEALGDILIRTATNPQQRETRGRAARALATRQYSAGAMVDAYVGAYVVPTESTRMRARESVGPAALER